ncbi:2401_t:CDS:1, partial [Funneliformis geosporum]
MSRNVEEMTGIGSESFSGIFLNPKRINTDLSKEILDLLVEYYCNAYNKDFVALLNIHITNLEAILVLSK